MKPLTRKQLTNLTDFIREMYGDNLAEFDFTDAFLLVLEDVSGYEVTDEHTLTPLISNAWQLYCR
jgi:hypothetical protein